MPCEHHLHLETWRRLQVKHFLAPSGVLSQDVTNAVSSAMVDLSMLQDTAICFQELTSKPSTSSTYECLTVVAHVLHPRAGDLAKARTVPHNSAKTSADTCAKTCSRSGGLHPRLHVAPSGAGASSASSRRGPRFRWRCPGAWTLVENVDQRSRKRNGTHGDALSCSQALLVLPPSLPPYNVACSSARAAGKAFESVPSQLASFGFGAVRGLPVRGLQMPVSYRSNSV